MWDAYLVILNVLSKVFFVKKINLFQNKKLGIQSVSISLEPDQNQLCMWPDLTSNGLQILSTTSLERIVSYLHVFTLQDISNKTKDLLNNLKSLATTEDDGKQYLTLESLKERKMPPATENFLFSLAACEGLVKL